MKRAGRAAALAAALLLGAGCGGDEAPDYAPDASAPSPQGVEGPSPERIEQLRALGYVESASAAASGASGAVWIDPDATWPGYSLYTAPSECRAYLVALDGTVVRSWHDDFSLDGGATSACHTWHHVELLPDGDLLVPVGAQPVPGRPNRTHLLRMGFDGSVRWRTTLRAHHDAELAPDGRILTLELRFRRDHPYEGGVPLMDNAIAFLSADGKLQRRISLYEVLRANPIGFALRPVVRPEGVQYHDLLHVNSVETVRDSPFVGRHPLYRPGNLLLSSRHQDAVFVIDPERKELVWLYGPGELSGQHDAQLLPNGNVLIFDNGLDREWSRVVELDPVTREIVWQYGDEREQRFFTSGRGAAQPLPNGNVLVANSNEGEAFEVTREGRIVWRYYHPEVDEKGHRRVIVRMIRYPAEWIEPLLAAGPEG